MKIRTLLASLATLALLAVPAGAHQTGSPHSHGKGPKCKTHNVAYVAAGTIVSHTLTQVAGSDTTDDQSDDRYSGELTLNVSKTNKHARGDKGEEKTYTLENDRVSFGEGATLANATRGRVIGKIARAAKGKKCAAVNAAAEPSIRKAVLKAPPTPEA